MAMNDSRPPKSERRWQNVREAIKRTIKMIKLKHKEPSEEPTGPRRAKGATLNSIDPVSATFAVSLIAPAVMGMLNLDDVLALAAAVVALAVIAGLLFAKPELRRHPIKVFRNTLGFVFLGTIAVVSFGLCGYLGWHAVGSGVLVKGKAITSLSLATHMAFGLGAGIWSARSFWRQLWKGKTRHEASDGRRPGAQVTLLEFIVLPTVLLAVLFTSPAKWFFMRDFLDSNVGAQIELLEGGYEEDRALAAYRLGKIGGKQAVDPLIDALDDENAKVRYIAAGALGNILDTKAIDPLIQLLADDEELVREAAAGSLGKTYDPVRSRGNFHEHAVERLIAELKRNNPDTREAVAEILATKIALRRVNPKYAPVIVGYIEEALKSEDIDTRRGAMLVLDKIESLHIHVPMDPLIRALQDEDAGIRLEAAHIFGKGIFSNFGAERDSVTATAVELLIKALGDENDEVATAAADALGNIRGYIAMLPVLKVLVSANEDIRLRAAGMLDVIECKELDSLRDIVSEGQESSDIWRAIATGTVDEAKLLDRLKYAFTAKRPRNYQSAGGHRRINRGAAILLARTNDPDAVKMLLQGSVLDHSDSLFVESVAWTLGEMGEPVLDPLIETALREKKHFGGRYYTRYTERVISVITKINSEKAADKFIEVLGDSDEEEMIRLRAAWFLGHIGGKKATDILISYLSDEEWRVRVNVVRALGHTGNKEAVDPLMLVLGNSEEDSTVRSYAISALGNIGDEKPVDMIMEFVNDKEYPARNQAIKALGQIGDKRAVERIVEFLSVEDPKTRVQAITALRNIGDERAVEPLIDLLSVNDLVHSRLTIREYVIGTLGQIGDKRALGPLRKILANSDPNKPRGVHYRAKKAIEAIEAKQKDAAKGAEKPAGLRPGRKQTRYSIDPFKLAMMGSQSRAASAIIDSTLQVRTERRQYAIAAPCSRIQFCRPSYILRLS